MKYNFLLLLTLLTFYKFSFSCDCQPKLSVSEGMKQASIVVHAKIIKAEYSKRLNQSMSYLDSVSRKLQETKRTPAIVNEYTVVIKEAFKGGG